MNFAYVSGRPSLDLLGTVKWRRRAEPEEQLLEPAAIGEWAVAAGLLDRPMRPTGTDLDRVRAVREALYRAVRARMSAAPVAAGDRRLLNEVARGPVLRMSFDPAGVVRRTGTVDELLGTVVLDGFDLVRGPILELVRECDQDDCTRLFVDSSRGGTRRWCGMADCGNRAKVRAFRERRRG
jgi:predicted RNA-binding Zn ribbon-like protein